ncbi:Oidioi.mRNA.OKI2018_I69.chr2.g7439.t1.cds [Oikopleura dioica]|uniref:Oidioi.mRNA.OKI2018_I69.chr2.g7439.t1.cds n=1 Tax=Oikopleura dioica TaxID=34765 RepID=A0ABN7T6P1_OIKDI|nr:Oidioi.mRNA.OKI2018_I69.chr2.g7439.t1.cds [Oikopleura dioica]
MSHDMSDDIDDESGGKGRRSFDFRKSIDELSYSLPYFGSYRAHKQTDDLERRISSALTEIEGNEKSIALAVGKIRAEALKNDESLLLQARSNSIELMDALEDHRQRYKKLSNFVRCILTKSQPCADIDYHSQGYLKALCRGSQNQNTTVAAQLEIENSCELIVGNYLYAIDEPHVSLYKDNQTFIGLRVTMEVKMPSVIRRYHEVKVESRGRINFDSYEVPDLNDVIIVREYSNNENSFRSFPRNKFCQQGIGEAYLCPLASSKPGFGMFQYMRISQSPFEFGRTHYHTNRVCIESGKQSFAVIKKEEGIEKIRSQECFRHLKYDKSCERCNHVCDASAVEDIIKDLLSNKKGSKHYRIPHFKVQDSKEIIWVPQGSETAVMTYEEAVEFCSQSLKKMHAHHFDRKLSHEKRIKCNAGEVELDRNQIYVEFDYGKSFGILPSRRTQGQFLNSQTVASLTYVFSAYDFDEEEWFRYVFHGLSYEKDISSIKILEDQAFERAASRGVDLTGRKILAVSDNSGGEFKERVDEKK